MLLWQTLFNITFIVDLLWLFLTILFLICLNRNVPTTKGRHFYNNVTISEEQMKIMSNLNVPSTHSIFHRNTFPNTDVSCLLYFFINNPFPTHPFTPHTKNIKKPIHITPRRNVIALWKNKTKKTKECKIPFYYQIERFLGKKIKLWVYESIMMKGKLNCSLIKFKQDFKKYERPIQWCLLICFSLEERVIEFTERFLQLYFSFVSNEFLHEFLNRLKVCKIFQ